MILAMLLNAHAGVTIEVDSLEVDGLAVRKLQCELDSGGLFASAMVVGKVSKVEVPKGSPEGAAACASKVLTSVEAQLNGSCSALVLLGEREGADKAADGLSVKPAPSE